jgi:hypothetical protein
MPPVTTSTDVNGSAREVFAYATDIGQRVVLAYEL